MVLPENPLARRGCVPSGGILNNPHLLYRAGRHARFLCATLKKRACAILLGCDCPSLGSNDLETALTGLNQDNDIVIAPAEDGGYTLVGLRKPQKEIFMDIPWGTSNVLAETRKKIKKLHLNYYELAEQWDVDEPEDYQRYLNLEH